MYNLTRIKINGHLFKLPKSKEASGQKTSFSHTPISMPRHVPVTLQQRFAALTLEHDQLKEAHEQLERKSIKMERCMEATILGMSKCISYVHTRGADEPAPKQPKFDPLYYLADVKAKQDAEKQEASGSKGEWYVPTSAFEIDPASD